MLRTLFSFVIALYAVAAQADTGSLATRNNLCLDVKDGGSSNGTQVQIWACSQGDKNQQWSLDGGHLKNANGKCLDLTDGGRNGTKLQIWDCSGGENQGWILTGQALQNTAHNVCVDVTDGAYENGTIVQAWDCDGRGSAGNQGWAFNGSIQTASGGGASTGATTFYGYPAIGIDDFMAKNPECAWIKDAVVSAANDQGLNATFLATACIVESSCIAPANGWGPFQFSDDSAWATYGGAGKDRQNIWDSAYGAARYFKDLLQQNGDNLDAALRAYNGPLDQGGNPQYQAEYRCWMSGDNAWNKGI